MGAETFLSTLDEGVQNALQTIEPDEHLISIVTRLLRLWDDTWNAHQYFRDVGKRVKNGKFCYRHPISGRVRSKVGYCDGCNLQFQGRAADGAKNALRLVSNWLYSTGQGTGHSDTVPPSGVTATGVTARGVTARGVTAWAFIHDEILFEGPEETVTEWAHEASELMVAGMQPYLKDLRVEAEPAAMRRWIKEAEPFYQDGQLIPWDREFVPVDHDIPEHLDVLQGPYYANHQYTEVKGPETELDKLYG